MSDLRRALIVDGPDKSLGQLAVRLMRLGIDVHYAADPAEALLLAGDVGEQVHLLIFPPSVRLDEIEGLQARLRLQAPDVPLTSLIVGKRPGPALRQRLRENGVELALWEPFDEGLLRAALAAALDPRARDPGLRKHPRVATTLLSRASMGLLRTDAIVSSLSLGGAFLESPDAFPDGARFELQIGLPEAYVTVQASVVHTTGGEARSVAGPSGMGVVFTRVDDEASRHLHRFLADQEERFAV